MDEATAEAVLAGGPRRILDVACGGGEFAARLAASGAGVVGLDPSGPLLQWARSLHGGRLTPVRGVAEVLPFPDGSFDRVVCKGSIDHFADPVAGMREMARVLKPDGRAIITLHNYGGATGRLGPLLWPLARRAGITRPDVRPTWSVPEDHTFRGAYRDFLRLGRQAMDLEACRGASMFFGLPFWPELLWPMGRRGALGMLTAADLVARAVPPLADVLVTVWRRRC
jgi:SAM-dependent methyltransferase